jgi:hypothetical protein
MKKINLLVGALAITAFGFVSCSDDDNDNANDVRIAGTYELEEVNTAAATDFNQDGKTNVNQMKESNCYNDGRIILNSDGTLKYAVTKILINTATGSVGCANTYQATGLWEAQDANAENTTVQAVFTNEAGNSQTINLVKTGDKLSYTDNTILTTYPDRNANGEAVNTRGAVTYVFDK